jgi:hypothetical protein
MNAEQKRMKPRLGDSGTSISEIFIDLMSTRTRVTEESWWSAKPWNGTCDCSCVT